jgi:hypothetical protein
MEVSEDLVDQVSVVLAASARERKRLTYKDLAAAVPGVPVRGEKMSAVLRQACRRSHHEKNVLITALVVNSTSGLPSEGFYELVRELRPSIESESAAEVIARREQERVYAEFPRL